MTWRRKLPIDPIDYAVYVVCSLKAFVGHLASLFTCPATLGIHHITALCSPCSCPERRRLSGWMHHLGSRPQVGSGVGIWSRCMET